MTDTLKLKGKIIEKGFTITSLAKHLGISKPTFSQKVNNKIRFSQDNIKDISKALELTSEEITTIFLS